MTNEKETKQNINAKQGANRSEDSKGSKSTNLDQTARLRIITSEEIESTRKGLKSEANSIKNFVKRKPLKTSSIYRKKYATLWIVVALVFIFAYQFVKVKEINFSELDTQLENKLNMDEMQKGNDITLRKLYGIDKTEVDKYCSFAPKSNMIASEILIIKARPESVDSIADRIQSRIDAQSNSFKNYAPDQYSIISQSQLKIKGDYIYYISSKKMNQIEDIINESYK